MYLDNEFDYNHDGQLDSWEQADREQTLYEMQLPKEERTPEFSRMIDDRGLDPYSNPNSNYQSNQVNTRGYTSPSRESGISDTAFGAIIFFGVLGFIVAVIAYVANM